MGAITNFLNASVHAFLPGCGEIVSFRYFLSLAHKPGKVTKRLFRPEFDL
jgi:hypothetical protein